MMTRKAVLLLAKIMGGITLVFVVIGVVTDIRMKKEEENRRKNFKPGYELVGLDPNRPVGEIRSIKQGEGHTIIVEYADFSNPPGAKALNMRKSTDVIELDLDKGTFDKEQMLEYLLDEVDFNDLVDYYGDDYGYEEPY